MTIFEHSVGSIWDRNQYRGADVGDGVRMAYRELGEGDAVLLIHGWPQHSLMWHTIGPRLAQRYRVIAPDLRGAGGTTVKGPYNKASIAGDVVRLLDLLSIDRVKLVGYDLGAGVAYDIAARYPDRVERLAFMEFGLPGFGYEYEMTAKPDWHNGSNWHLSFFTLPDVAEWAFRGRERELLSWFFNHIAMASGAVAAHDAGARRRRRGKCGRMGVRRVEGGGRRRDWLHRPSRGPLARRRES